MCLLIIIGILGGAIVLIVKQFIEFGSELPLLAEKIGNYIEDIQRFVRDTFEIAVQTQSDYLDDMVENSISSGGAILTYTASSTLSILTTIFLLVIYILYHVLPHVFQKSNLHGF